MKFNPMVYVGACLILMFGFVFYVLIGGAHLDQVQKESCSKLDMEYYTAQDSIFCVDKGGDAHYVIIDCELLGFWWEWDCTPKIITIGDIRTKEVK